VAATKRARWVIGEGVGKRTPPAFEQEQETAARE
jgi:hypothetical protein